MLTIGYPLSILWVPAKDRDRDVVSESALYSQSSDFSLKTL